MPSHARYYDGATALVQEVRVRPTAGELILFDPADASIVARWPIEEIDVLGDAAHESAPPVVRRGGEARLVIEDLEQRRQLASLVPRLAALAAVPASPGRRIVALGSTLAVRARHTDRSRLPIAFPLR